MIGICQLQTEKKHYTFITMRKGILFLAMLPWSFVHSDIPLSKLPWQFPTQWLLDRLWTIKPTVDEDWCWFKTSSCINSSKYSEVTAENYKLPVVNLLFALQNKNDLLKLQ